MSDFNEFLVSWGSSLEEFHQAGHTDTLLANSQMFILLYSQSGHSTTTWLNGYDINYSIACQQLMTCMAFCFVIYSVTSQWKQIAYLA